MGRLDVPGGGGTQIKDMMLITDGDPRVLSRVEYEEKLNRPGFHGDSFS